MRDEVAVSDLAAAYPMTFAAVQRHVAVLEDAGLVVKRPVHRHRFVRARPEALDEVMTALGVLRDQWHDRVERMHDVLDTDPPSTDPRTTDPRITDPRTGESGVTG